MAQVCENCGKKPHMGHRVSHSNIKTLRRFNINLQKKRFFDLKLGKMVLRKMCTGCMRTLVKLRPARNAKVGAKKAAVTA